MTRQLYLKVTLWHGMEILTRLHLPKTRAAIAKFINDVSNGINNKNSYMLEIKNQAIFNLDYVTNIQVVML